MRAQKAAAAVDLFDAVAAFLPEHVVRPESARALREAARLLPACSGMGLELHLGEAGPRADLMQRLTRAELRSQSESGRNGSSGGALSAPALVQPRWQPLREFLQLWGSSAAPPNELASVENVWVELDLGSSYSMSSAPSIFFDIDRNGRLSVEAKLGVVRAVLQTLRHAPDPAHLELLARSAAMLPPELQLYNIGLMLSRDVAGLRVVVLGESAPLALDYLERIGWRGDRERITQQLLRYGVGPGKIILDFDLSERVHEAIGLEIFADSHFGWADFLPRLAHDGLCNEGEIDALLSWPGRSSFDVQTNDHSDGRAASSVIRRINHIKLCFAPSGAVRAKAYLYFCTI